MDISVRWLNEYLAPGASGLGEVSPDEADAVLTHAGFPIESSEARPNGDSFLDVEVTSNRGDCLSHVGLAREVAAATRRELKVPEWTDPPTSGDVADHLTLDNREPGVCPLFTARVIRGCTVGPSPAWLVERLESVGQRSINNVVDVTNFITFELGHPCHVFDLKKLRGSSLVIRWATDGERLRTLDGREHTLASDILVVADAERATSLAGVIGGGDSEVSADTTDVVLEMATWDPVTVRTASRRIKTRTDASFRFERWVSAREIDAAARRAAALIVELTGGTLCGGALERGAPLPEPVTATLRPQRARDLIGVDIPDGEVARLLGAHEIGVERAGDTLRCTIPAFRNDLTREVDLIEEVCRTHGFDSIPVRDRLAVRVHPPQPRESGAREIGTLLAGMGFYETVTFSFVTPEAADLFTPPGLRAVAVDDERRAAEPTLRPSVVPSLLACRKANQDAGVEIPGGVRLFEVSAVFAETERGESVESRNLSLLVDAPGRSPDELGRGVRLMRGVIESIVRAAAGPEADLHFEPSEPPMPALAAASARITLGGKPLGYLAPIGENTRKRFDLESPAIVAEINADALLAAYPPAARVTTLPEFPGVERDVSLVVPETLRWSGVEALVRRLGLGSLEGCAFVGVYRGTSVGAGKKSLTLRLRFRHASRTLRHEEVDPQIERFVAEAAGTLDAILRA